MKLKRRIDTSFCWVTYARSFLLTVGLAFIAFAAFAWSKDDGSAPAWVYLIVLGFLAFGVTLVGVGLFAGGTRVEKWADDASRGGIAVIVLMVVALPLYLFMVFFKRLRNG